MLLLLTVVCFLVMLPRLRATQFGLLDDGVTVKIAQLLPQDPIKAFTSMKAAGRFLPSYWFTETLVYQFAGLSSLRWFYINVFVLVLDTLAIFWIVRFRGGSLIQATLAGLFFCFSAPVIETFYTLSKPDLIMTSWIIWGILLALRSHLSKRNWVKICFLLGAIFSIGMAFGTKEPAVVLICIALGWFILARLFRNAPEDLFDFSASKSFFFLVLVLFIIYILLRFYFVPVNPLASGYSSNYKLSFESINAQLLRWLGRFLRDFFYILPILFVLFNRKVWNLVNKRLLIDSLFWMAGWFVIFLPWNVLESFHTLPFAVGVAIVSGTCSGAALQVFFGESDTGDRIYLSLVLLIALFFVQFTIVNNISTARVQLFYDRVNNRMVKFLAKNKTSNTILFNIPYTEYFTETGLHLNVFWNRNDLNLDYFKYQRPLDSEPFHYFIVNPVMVNAPLPSVRNSLNERGVLTWNQCLISSLNPNKSFPVYDGRQKLRWVDFGANRLLGWIGLEDKYSYNVKDRLFFESKEMDYGWQVYEIILDPSQMAFPGNYNGAGEWRLSTSKGERSVYQFGLPGDIPLTGDFNGDGRTEIGLYRPAVNKYLYDLDFNGKPDLSFILPKMEDGDIPVVGDWNGDGIDTPGYYRPVDSTWHLRNENNAGDDDFAVTIPGPQGLVPLAGDWDADGYDTFGFYLPSTGEVYLMDTLSPNGGFSWAYQTDLGAKPIAADWYGFGRDTLAIVKDGQWSLRPNNVSCEFPNPIPSLKYGNPKDIPVGGVW
jgi:hypothetical protein